MEAVTDGTDQIRFRTRLYSFRVATTALAFTVRSSVTSVVTSSHTTGRHPQLYMEHYTLSPLASAVAAFILDSTWSYAVIGAYFGVSPSPLHLAEGRHSTSVSGCGPVK